MIVKVKAKPRLYMNDTIYSLSGLTLKIKYKINGQRFYRATEVSLVEAGFKKVYDDNGRYFGYESMERSEFIQECSEVLKDMKSLKEKAIDAVIKEINNKYQDELDSVNLTSLSKTVKETNIVFDFELEK